LIFLNLLKKSKKLNYAMETIVNVLAVLIFIFYIMFFYHNLGLYMFSYKTFINGNIYKVGINNNELTINEIIDRLVNKNFKYVKRGIYGDHNKYYLFRKSFINQILVKEYWVDYRIIVVEGENKEILFITDKFILYAFYCIIVLIVLVIFHVIFENYIYSIFLSISSLILIYLYLFNYYYPKISNYLNRLYYNHIFNNKIK